MSSAPETGGVINYTVVVNGQGTTPTGSVTISYTDVADSTNTGSCTASLDGSGTGSCSLTPPTDAYFITASYGGDSNYGAATGTMPSMVVGDDDSGAETGGTFTYTATVSDPSGSGTPTGTVSWDLSGSPGGPMCPASTLSPAGTATCEVTNALSGTYAVTATYSGDTNYTGVAASDDTAGVGPAPLVITASDGTMTYGGGTPSITASYNGFENGDDPPASRTEPTCSSNATSSSPVGSYSSSCTGAYDPNYTISYVQGSVSVGPATLTITASDASMTYGGSAPAISPSFSGFKNGDSASSLTTQPTCSTSASSTSPVGSYASSCSGASAANYTISYKNGSVTVGKTPLTVTASNGSMTYGGNPPSITRRLQRLCERRWTLQPFHQADVLDERHELELGRRIPLCLFVLRRERGGLLDQLRERQCGGQPCPAQDHGF